MFLKHFDEVFNGEYDLNQITIPEDKDEKLLFDNLGDDRDLHWPATLERLLNVTPNEDVKKSVLLKLAKNGDFAAEIYLLTKCYKNYDIHTCYEVFSVLVESFNQHKSLLDEEFYRYLNIYDIYYESDYLLDKKIKSCLAVHFDHIPDKCDDYDDFDYSVYIKFMELDNKWHTKVVFPKDNSDFFNIVWSYLAYIFYDRDEEGFVPVMAYDPYPDEDIHIFDDEEGYPLYVYTPLFINNKSPIGVGLLNDLAVLYISSNVKYISTDAGDMVFNGHSFPDTPFLQLTFKKIVIDKDNPYFLKCDNFILSHDKTIAFSYLPTDDEKILNVPEGVVRIGSYFSHCYKHITRINLPSSLKEISTYAFAHLLDDVEAILIPSSVEKIEKNAFCADYQNLYEQDSLTIYCEATEKPAGWHENWNPLNIPVVWGYKNK